MGKEAVGGDGYGRAKAVGVIDAGGSSDPSEDDYVVFHAAGDAAKGEFRCSGCGYGVAVARRLPVCPMCGGREWEETAWSPFSRAARLL